MATIEIKIKNINRILAALSDSPRAVRSGIQRAIERAGALVAGKTKEHITAGTQMWKPPIDTGAMRRGIQAGFQPMKAIIRPSSMTPYATYVHEGTNRMTARPFFEITAKYEQKNIEKFFNEEMEKVVANIANKSR